MIREVLPDVIALVVFSLGGAFYGLLIVYALPYFNKDIKSWISSFLLGSTGGTIFIILTEIYYSTRVTTYTAICYLITTFGTLFFFSEKPAKTKKEKAQKRKIHQKRK